MARDIHITIQKNFCKITPFNVNRHLFFITFDSNFQNVPTNNTNGDLLIYNNEIYDAENNSFTKVAPMNKQRRYHCCATLENDLIFICGGRESFGRAGDAEALDTCELYDYTTNKWSTILNTMCKKRYGCRCVALANGNILIIGGYDGTYTTKTCEIYDPITKSFTLSKSSLNLNRFYCAVVLLQNGDVFVCGGYDSQTQFETSLCEIFDCKTQEWRLLPPNNSMLIARRNHSCALLDDGKVLITGGFNR